MIRLRWTLVPDAWCLGVSPTQEVSCSGRAKRVTSPIRATSTAPGKGPFHGFVWTAVWLGCRPDAHGPFCRSG